MRPIDRIDHRRVTMAASGLGNPFVSRRYLNRFVKLARRKSKAMPEPVRRLRHVLTDEIMGGVTIITGGDASVASLEPSFVLLVHDVAVDARLGIIG